MTTTHAAGTPPPPPLPPPGASPDGRIAWRLYRGPEELPGMMEANLRMRTAAGVPEPIDMASITHRYTHLENSDPPVDCIVVTRDGETVGYARVEWHDLTDGDRQYEFTLVVAPDAWGLGITETALAWCEARLRQLAGDHDLPPGTRCWIQTGIFDADGDDTPDVLRAHGYEIARLGADMARPDLDDVPDLPAPDGYAFRAPRADELRRVSDMNVEAFRDHWGEHDSDPESHFLEWTEEPRFDPALLAVLWAGDEPACLVGIMLDRREDGTVGAYVSSVGTHPAHRRRGLARAALARALRLARDAGATDAYLGVDAENQHRAFALYEDLGFRKVAGNTAWRKPFDPEPRP